jgi:ubiquinone/menaquinone biosynthesis C-methylase UbiE
LDYRQSHIAKGESYDATIAAQPFDAYMARCEAQYLREVIPSLTHRGARYLDFACGTGRITATVSPLVTESVGIDVSDSMLAAARDKCPSTRFVCADLTQQPLELLDLGEFDLVTSFRFLGNAEHALRDRALAAISRLVRHGGYLVVNSHRNPLAIGSLLQRFAGRAHGMDLTYWKLKRLLQAHGFRIVAARAIGFWVVRARLRQPELLESRTAQAADRLFRGWLWAPWSPDCVVVAKKF